MDIIEKYKNIDEEETDKRSKKSRTIKKGSIVKSKKEKTPKFYDMLGVTLTVEGTVAKIEYEDRNILIYVNTGDNNSITCSYEDLNYPIKKDDKINATGVFEEREINEKKVVVLVCYYVHCRYIFDLNCILKDLNPLNDEEFYVNRKTKKKYNNGELSDEKARDVEERIALGIEETAKYDRKIETLASKIQEYSSIYYGSNQKDLSLCLYDLSRSLDSNKIKEFSDFIGKKYKSTRNMLYMYRNDCLKRPLQLLGIPITQIDSIRRPLHEAYEIAYENPYRIPEVTEEVVEYIFRQYIKEEPQDDWIICGKIARTIYNKYKKNSWTSFPEIRIQSIFKSNYDSNRNELPGYFIKYSLDSWYYSPILEIETFVAKEIADRIVDTNEVTTALIISKHEVTEEQRNAVNGSLTNRVSFISGAAGVGKTECIGHICQELINKEFVPLIVTYTGAAVNIIKGYLRERKICEQCHVYTVHLSIMRANTGEDSIRYSHVIFDEFSMIDMTLLRDFMRAFEDKNLSYIFAGDINQLEPMAPGNVMQQLLLVNVPIYYLTINFRSQKGIVDIIDSIVNPERIQEKLEIEWQNTSDDYEFHTGGRLTLQSLVEKNYKHIPKRLRKNINEETMPQIVEIIDDYTIVTYYRKSVFEINSFVQSVYMKDFPSVVIDSKKFCIYDRVMNCQNNYSVDVMNGEIGKVIEITDNYIGVEYDSKPEKRIVYFGKYKMERIKAIRKKIGLEYSTKSTINNSIEVKSLTTIQTELKPLKEKFKSKSNKYISDEDIEYFFDVAMKYPYSLFGYTGDKEFLKLENLNLAYCITVRKSQGSQFKYCTFLQEGLAPYYLNRRVIYTGCSRAQEKLTIVCESEEILNAAVCYGDSFVNDNLSRRINNLLPDSYKKVVELVETIPEYEAEEDMCYGCDDYDDIDFDDIY